MSCIIFLQCFLTSLEIEDYSFDSFCEHFFVFVFGIRILFCSLFFLEITLQGIWLQYFYVSQFDVKWFSKTFSRRYGFE